MKKTTALILLLFMLATACFGCAARQEEAAGLPDRATANIAVLVGTTSEKIVDIEFPEANKLPFDSINDAVMALQAGKADYVVTAYTNCVNFVRAYPGELEMLPDKLSDEGAAIAVNKSETELLRKIDGVLAQFREDGTLDRIVKNWVRDDGSAYVQDEIPVNESGEVLDVAVSAEREPMCFVENGNIVGLDAELIQRIAYELGMKVQFHDMKFAAMIPSVLSGKTPVAISNMTATDERRESVNFTEDYFVNAQMLLTRATGGADSAKTANGKPVYTTLASLAGKRIGIITGSIFDQFALAQWPDAELLYYENNASMIIALQQGKIEAFLNDQPVARQMAQSTEGIVILDEMLAPDEYGFAFQKTDAGAALRDEFNEFMRTADDGKLLENLDALWFGMDEENKVVEDAASLPATNGVVRFATSMESAPFNYLKDEKPVGVEVDLITRFCKEKGYGLEIETVSFGALLPGLVSDRYDAVASSISITEERAQSVNFSDAFYQGGVVAMALAPEGGETSSLAGTLRTYDDVIAWLPGKSLGMYMGATVTEPMAALIEKSEKVWLNTYTDMATALKAGQIDGFFCEEPVAPFICAAAGGLYTNGVLLNEENYACVFAKESVKLCDELNETIKRLTDDGTLDKLRKKWWSTDESKHVMPEIALTGENGTLHIATSNDTAPFGYIRDGEFVGYDFEILAYFAEEHGYALEYDMIDWAATTAAVTSGKYDIGVGCMCPTEERSDAVLFSDPICYSGVALITSDEYAPKTIANAVPVETARIGAMTGSTCEACVYEQFPDAEYSSFTSTSDLMTALKNGKLDYALTNEIDAVNYMRSDAKYVLYDEDVSTERLSIAVKKGNTELLSKLDELIQKYKEDGTLARLKRNWMRTDGSAYVMEEIPEVAEGATLTVASCSELEPACFIKDGKLVGHDVELAKLLAYELGMKVEFVDMQFSALIAAVESGRADMAICGIAATPERREKVDFSETYYEDALVLLCYDGETAAAEKGFFDELAKSFNKNFIVENRWKLIVDGIGVTILLSICSGVFGIVVGFGFCLMRRSRARALGAIASVITRILQGTPMVVLLMILYYIVFNKTGLDGIAVSIIAFGLNFGAYASEIMLSGINAVDNGQNEAAAAIGFSSSQTFWKIIFPQAARHFLPVLKGEYISLVKMTSIVGYVAVQDLTKVSDIIRSRTYEAFFPLIVTAVIYFLLSFGLSSLLRLIEVKIDPKHRPRTLKGVNLK